MFERWEQPPPRSGEGSMTALELLSNLLFPLILVLAMSTIIAGGQRQSIQEIERVAKQLEQTDKHKLVIELFRQQLIRKIDAACGQRRTALQIDLFPDFSRVRLQDGLLADPAFGQLCINAQASFSKLDRLTLEIYSAALAHREEGVELMYDTVLFEGTAPDVNAANILGTSPEAQEHREFALARIRERCLAWQEQVVGLQRQAILSFLDSSAVGSVRATETEQLRHRLRAEFQLRGYPLLDQAL